MRPGPLRPASRTNERRGRSEETTEWPRVALSDSLHPAAARICSRLLHLPSHREPRAASREPRSRGRDAIHACDATRIALPHRRAAAVESRRIGSRQPRSTDTSTDASTLTSCPPPPLATLSRNENSICSINSRLEHTDRAVHRIPSFFSFFFPFFSSPC